MGYDLGVFNIIMKVGFIGGGEETVVPEEKPQTYTKSLTILIRWHCSAHCHQQHALNAISNNNEFSLI